MLRYGLDVLSSIRIWATLVHKPGCYDMNQLTLTLAATTCRLSDILRAIRQQEALIKALRAQGRPVDGAQALLECFKDSAAAIAYQREHLECQMLLLLGLTRYAQRVGAR
jgi:hypothetical protein